MQQQRSSFLCVSWRCEELIKASIKNDETRRMLQRAMYDYVFRGDEPSFDGEAANVWKEMRRLIDHGLIEQFTPISGYWKNKYKQDKNQKQHEEN